MCRLFVIAAVLSVFSEKALAVTNYKGVEPAMEWLLAHADDPEPSAGYTIAGATTTSEPPANPAPASDPATSTEEPSEQEAKSLKCDECGKLFKNQDEMEFHAAKTNHSSFSESTEEKKPLTEEEKRAQMALLEERMKQKRKEREEKEKVPTYIFKVFLNYCISLLVSSCFTFSFNNSIL